MNLPQPSDYEIEQSFMEFLQANGIYPVGSFRFVINGIVQRYQLEGDRSGETSGSYAVYNDRGWPIGWARDWHNGQTIEWFYKTDGLSKEERDYIYSDEFKKKAEEAKRKWEAEIKQRQDAAADDARTRIEAMSEAPENHPYLQKKHVFPYGIKENGYGTLAVPIKDIDGNIRSLQWITAEGDKRLLQDASTKGCFWSVGMDLLKEHPALPILLGEGFATMAKVYELTGFPSVAGISCSGLKGAAQAIKGKYPDSKIIVMADNDKATEVKRGVNSGIDAAQKLVDAKLAVAFIYPEFPDNNGTDWDDYAILNGDEETANILQDKISYALIPAHIKKIQEHVTSINAQDLRYKVFPPLKWAVDGFLPAGLSILAGGPKIGKSILSLHLAIGVAIGGCVLGKIFVQKGDVLYLALEDTQKRLQERINNSSIVDDEVDLSGLQIITEIPRQHLGGLAYIRYWLETHTEARLVIIDTLQMFRRQLSGKGSMYSEDYDVISEIKKLADEFGVAFLIIHHLKKGMEGDWLSEISGSQGISGAADTIFSLKRERNSCMGTLHRTGRDVEEQDFIMKLDGYGWTLQGEAEEFTMPEWKRQVLDYLKENPSVTPIQLAQVYGLDAKTAQKNLARLMQEGTIQKTGRGTYGLPEE